MNITKSKSLNKSKSSSESSRITSKFASNTLTSLTDLPTPKSISTMTSTSSASLSELPELYPDLINLNAIPSILNLLAHNNTDIVVDVVQLLQDLMDPDVFEDDEESDEPARVLVDALVENNVLELLVHNLQWLNDFDPDEMAAVYSMFTMVENLVEVKPAVAEMVCERTKLLKWLLGKIKVREDELLQCEFGD